MRFLRNFFSPLTTARKLVLSTVLVALFGLGLLWPLLTQPGSVAPAPVDVGSRITDYAADYRVAADGRVHATEVLTVDIAANRHGIFRFFPVDDPTDPHARRVPAVTAVTLDGQAVPVDFDWRNARRMYVARIGDPEQLVAPGVHNYTISYTFDGGLVPTPDAPGESTTAAGTDPGTATASFYYDVVGFWNMAIDAAQVTIELPGPAAPVRCAADPTGAIPCEITGAGTGHLTVTTGALPAHNPVTVRADLHAELPRRALTLPWTPRFDKILGRSIPVAGLVAALSLVGALGGWLWSRRSREDTPGAPVLYAPPDGLGPVQTAYIVNETVGEHALVATVLQMAERKLVRLDGADPKDWTITGTGESWDGVDPVTRQVADTLGVTVAGGTLTVGDGVSAGEKLATAQQDLRSGCRSWSREQKLMVTAVAEWTGKVGVLLALVLAVVAFAGTFIWTMWGVPFAAFGVAGLGLLSTGVGSRRTRAGRDVWSRAAGFQRLLSTPSSADRFDFAARKDLFIAYIPYAVAFGVAETWAAKYRTATGAEAPTPTWYPVAATTGGRPTGLYVAGGLAGFGAAVGASISAYNSSRSSSSGSSGWSGGGGSWGGGGGGGGGTW